MPAASDVAAFLDELASANRRRGDAYRARAYARAAREVRRRADFDALLAAGRLREVPGIGPSIERTVTAFVREGARPSWLDAPAPPRPGLAAFPVPASFGRAPFAGVPDLHVHSTWSDGALGLDDVATLARRLGAEAVGVSDHSASLRIAHGLGAAEVALQRDALREVATRHPDVVLLHGTECDVRPDGSLDHDVATLREFDYVIGSLHAALRLPRAAQTARLLRAIADVHLDVLGHPTTRVPGRRGPIEFDEARVLAAAARAGVALEVNGSAGRLDLDADAARRALDAGCRLSLGSDAHDAGEMLALETARRTAAAAGASEEDLYDPRVDGRRITRGGRGRVPCTGGRRGPSRAP